MFGVIPATTFVPYSTIWRVWNSPSRPVIPWTTSRVSRPIEDAHASTARRRGDGLAGRLVETRSRLEPGLGEEPAGLLGVRPDDPDDHRHVALLDGPCLDEPAGDLVAAGDPAEDVDEDRPDLRVVEDEPQGRGHLVGPGPAADVEEVGRLAAGPLDEVHRGHRQAGPVDHAADRAVEVDERDALGARLGVGRVLRLEVSQRLEVGVAGEGRIVEGDLGVEADEVLRRTAVFVRLPDDCERVDLDQVGIVGQHRRDEAPGDPDEGAQMRPAEPDREGQPTGLPVEQAEERVGLDPMDRPGIDPGDLFDLDAALGGRHQDDPPAGPIEDRPEVELLDDVGGGRDEDLADGDVLDRKRRGCRWRQPRPRPPSRPA